MCIFQTSLPRRPTSFPARPDFTHTQQNVFHRHQTQLGFGRWLFPMWWGFFNFFYWIVMPILLSVPILWIFIHLNSSEVQLGRACSSWGRSPEVTAIYTLHHNFLYFYVFSFHTLQHRTKPRVFSLSFDETLFFHDVNNSSVFKMAAFPVH